MVQTLLTYGASANSFSLQVNFPMLICYILNYATVTYMLKTHANVHLIWPRWGLKYLIIGDLFLEQYLHIYKPSPN